MLKRLAGLSIAAMLISAPAAANNILFILDASGSMWGQLDGTAKITTAKTALARLLNDVPRDTNIGLMAYGHTSKEDCKDVHILTPLVDARGRARIVAAVRDLQPKGKTPIAYSLEQAGAYLATGHSDDTNNIVLISDGIETCDGNPCDMAARLSGQNIGVKIHVVGFDIAEKDRQQLECIADAGKGKYFAAKSTAGFAKAVSAAVKVAQAKPAPPPAPKPASSVYFIDNFDGTELGEHWTVLNKDEEAYIVENGLLTVILQDKKKPKFQDIPNVFRLIKPVPKGDWVITAKIKFVPQTFEEYLGVGLTKTDGTQLLAGVFMSTSNYVRTNIQVRGDKKTSKPAKFARVAFKTDSRDRVKRAEQYRKRSQWTWIRLRKKGRKYIASAKFSETESWIVVQELASLRLPGDAFTLLFDSGAYSGYNPKGTESTVEVDWVKIVAADD